MSDLMKPVDGNTALAVAVINKTTQLSSMAARGDFDALLLSTEIRRRGIPVFISGAIDVTGSMQDDIANVTQGVSGWLKRYTASLPEQVTERLGDSFLRISGSTIKFRDIDCDGEDSFKMTVFNRVLPETYISKSTASINQEEVSGGGGNLGESSLLALMMSLGIPRINTIVGSVFEQLNQIIGQEKHDKLIAQYDAFTGLERRPDMVYLVTDEPPKVQLGISADTIASLGQQIKLPRMVFFVRNYTKEWQAIANKLGAEVYDLAEADKANTVDKSTVITDFLNTSFAGALLSSINSSLPQLTSPTA